MAPKTAPTPLFAIKEPAALDLVGEGEVEEGEVEVDFGVVETEPVPEEAGEEAADPPVVLAAPLVGEVKETV